MCTGAGGVAQQVRVLLLWRVPAQFQAPMPIGSQPLVILALGGTALSSGLCGYLHTCVTHIQMHVHTHTSF